MFSCLHAFSKLLAQVLDNGLCSLQDVQVQTIWNLVVKPHSARVCHIPSGGRVEGVNRPGGEALNLSRSPFDGAGCDLTDVRWSVRATVTLVACCQLSER